MVSPLEKLGYSYSEAFGMTDATGTSFFTMNSGAFAEPKGAPPQSSYLSRRTADGWRTENITPRQAPRAGTSFSAGRSWAATPDFGKFLFTNEGVELGPGAPLSYSFFTSRHGRRLVSHRHPHQPHECSQPPGIRGRIGGLLPDRLLDGQKGITPEYTGEHPSLYLSEIRVSKLVSVLPNGTPAEGVIYSGPTGAPSVTDEGSRIFFTTESDGQIYMRENGERTIWVSRSQRAIPDPEGPRGASFLAASADGSVVFFTSEEKLTDDSTAAAGSADLYRYTISGDRLEDLTVDTSDPNGAQVLGMVFAAEDGHRLYFVAKEISPGTPRRANRTCMRGTTETFGLWPRCSQVSPAATNSTGTRINVTRGATRPARSSCSSQS